jgi:hypothetical protein
MGMHCQTYCRQRASLTGLSGCTARYGSMPLSAALGVSSSDAQLCPAHVSQCESAYRLVCASALGLPEHWLINTLKEYYICTLNAFKACGIRRS